MAFRRTDFKSLSQGNKKQNTVKEELLTLKFLQKTRKNVLKLHEKQPCQKFLNSIEFLEQRIRDTVDALWNLTGERKYLHRESFMCAEKNP